MQALVKTAKGIGQIEVVERDKPVIQPNEVLIQIDAAAVCGTDIHIFHDRFPYWPPVTLGHEFAGEIAEVGSEVATWKVGDRVVGEPHTLACGHCPLCRSGNPQICNDKRSPGWGIDGAFARYMRFPDPKLLHRIPEGMDAATACLAEPMANIVSDLVLNNVVKVGDTVMVSGPGPIGIMAALTCKYMGASRVIVVGTNQDELTRLPFCRNQRAIDNVINVQKENALAIINELTNGMGVDVVVEASGAAPAIKMGVNALRKMGTYTAIGLTGRDEISFPYDTFMKKAVNFHFNISTKYASWEPAIKMLADGVIPVDEYITHLGSIDNWKSMFEALESGHAIKAIFEF
jgi:L-iditol 2-dehydrogenase